MRIDAHVRIGAQRETALTVEQLLTVMDSHRIDRAMIAPSEAQIAFHNREGNDAVAAAAKRSGGRLIPYAVATPWAGRAAVDELARARDNGARALCVDSSLQGFDLLDGMIEPLLIFAAEASWPVYVRTGSPPGHLPLPTALLARRHPELAVIMGRSGATDFWIDAAPALRDAANLYGDTSYAPWDTVLADFATDPEIGPGRLVFATDLPYTTAAGEVQRILDWPITEAERDQVFGATLAGLLGLQDADILINEGNPT
ncbi:amidohydrolase family protein [Microlunatus soli]|uniref:Amidohydrolase n=1 Tax=Microlunatus soli TaxID=630515 RepID=A0A1H1Z1Q3_9ACTN|nr:amidohydrolase family protein [Microlunatus soli]SDT27527.1 Amidohydrolase [Microlunatus soli]